MKLVLFEDNQFDHFLPLAYTRGVFELKTGATSLADKISRATQTRIAAVLARDYLGATLKRRLPGVAFNDLSACTGDEVLFVNARVCGTEFKPPDRRVALWKGNQLAAWRTGDNVAGLRDYAALAAAAGKAERADYTGGWFEYIWDVMLNNPREIEADFKAAGKRGVEGTLHESAVVFGPRENLYIGPKAEIHPLVCLDTRHGPITIEAGCEVHPFTRVEGPCYLGPGSILLGAKVREGCSIGPMCRVGGEVEESIIHGYSNKYHDGFLGHAYVGEWVNLGALTTNSDLKNDYTSVSVMMPGGRTVSTGSTKVGSFIADHVKTSIGTLLNTGTIVGTMAVLVATGAPLPKYIPPFAWFLNGIVSKGFGITALLSTARIAMSRRKVEMTADDEALLRHVYELTAAERTAYINKGKRQLAARTGEGA